MKLYIFFGQDLCPSSGVFYCTHTHTHTAMVYVIQLASRIRTELQFRPDPARKLYDIYHCCVCVCVCVCAVKKLLMMDRETVRNM